MDWKALSALTPRDPDMPARSWAIATLSTVLDGTLYDRVASAYDAELDGGKYVPLSQRRPSVRTGLCRTVVDDAVSLLFGEGHYPTVTGSSDAVTKALAAWVKERRINEVMCDAATRGSVGSVCLLLRVLKRKPFLSVITTENLTPAWSPNDPDMLVSVTERYKVSASVLVAQGYAVRVEDGDHWFQRVWDADAETWYLPIPVRPQTGHRSPAPVVDAARTVRHGLGFTPCVWVRNLPGGDGVDGACTFRAGLDTVIEVDYQLSQAGRGLKYASDPKLMVRDPSGQDLPMSGGAASAIVLSDEKADAKFLEINGTAAAAVESYVRYLRQLALEAMHGARADPDKLTSTQSGKAMEMLHQGLVWLADKLRTSYGEGALLAVYRMVCEASQVVKGGLLIGGADVAGLDPVGLVLSWPRWFAPTAADRQNDASTLVALTTGGVLSHESALRSVADDYDVEDVQAEMARILAEAEAADARAAALAAQVKATETLTP